MKGERMAELRKDKGMTQEQLGKELNVSQKAISSYENNRTKVPDDVTVKMADFFGVTTDYLLGRTREQNSIDTVIKKLPSKAEQEMKQYLVYLRKKYNKTK